MVSAPRPDLDALAALLNDADSLPWEVQKDGWTIRVEQKDTEKDRGWRVAMTHHSGPNRVEREVANAELIVAAVNALPDLLAYVRELERERDQSALNRACADALVSAAQDMTHAAALAMRERCARECETSAVTRLSEGHDVQKMAAVCAAAIRALEP